MTVLMKFTDRVFIIQIIILKICRLKKLNKHSKKIFQNKDIIHFSYPNSLQLIIHFKKIKIMIKIIIEILNRQCI